MCCYPLLISLAGDLGSSSSVSALLAMGADVHARSQAGLCASIDSHKLVKLGEEERRPSG